MQTLVEKGPSNASQGQHRRKDATEQIKNHQQDKQVLGGCLRNREGQAAVQ